MLKRWFQSRTKESSTFYRTLKTMLLLSWDILTGTICKSKVSGLTSRIYQSKLDLSLINKFLKVNQKYKQQPKSKTITPAQFATVSLKNRTMLLTHYHVATSFVQNAGLFIWKIRLKRDLTAYSPNAPSYIAIY